MNHTVNQRLRVNGAYDASTLPWEPRLEGVLLCKIDDILPTVVKSNASKRHVMRAAFRLPITVVHNSRDINLDPKIMHNHHLSETGSASIADS